jgi:type 1 glutamine amidotransferase
MKSEVFAAIVLCAGASVFAQGNLKKVLVFDKTGYTSQEPWTPADSMMAQLGHAFGFSVRTTKDSTLFTDDTLKQYQVIAWNNVMRNVLSPAQQAAFKRYMENGGGYVGWHASATNRSLWPWYVDSLLGGDNAGGIEWGPPVIFSDTILRAGHSLGVEHPIMQGIPRIFSRRDSTEWYLWTPDPANNPAITVLQWFTAKSVNTSWPTLLPATWCREYGSGTVRGRVFYTIMSHADTMYANTYYRRMILNALRWAAKDGDAGIRQFESDKTVSVARESLYNAKTCALNGRSMRQLQAGQIVIITSANRSATRAGGGALKPILRR